MATPSIITIPASKRKRYVSHPLNLPLVVTSELPADADPHFLFFDYVESRTPEAVAKMEARKEDIILYQEHVIIPDNPLSVDETDGEKKRYKAYQRWIMTGKLKQQRIMGLGIH